MANANEEHAQTILQTTDGGFIFQQLVDALVIQVRRTLGVSAEAASDPVVDEEFAALRDRMLTFLPQYQEAYTRLLSKHIGVDHLAECAKALQSDPLQQYFGAMRAMRPELAKEMAALGQKIGELTIRE